MPFTPPNRPVRAWLGAQFLWLSVLLGLAGCDAESTASGSNGLADAANSSSDGAVADAAADANAAKTCTPNKQFCDGDQIRYCKPNGSWGDVKTTCPTGKVCAIEAGAAACVDPPPSADTLDTADGAATSDAEDTADSGTSPDAADTAGSTDTADAADTADSVEPADIADTADVADSADIADIADTTADSPDATDLSDIADTADTTDTATADTPSTDTTDTAVAKTCKPNVNFCDGDKIMYCKNDGTWGTVKSTCQAGNVCGIDGNAAVCIPGTYTCDGSGCVCKPEVPDQCVKVVKTGTTLGYVYGVKKRTSCYDNTTITECAEFNSCYEGACTSSVSDPSSPYWYKSCDLTQYLTYKTGLAADCRCATNQALVSGLVPCKRPYEVWKAGGKIGDGPRAAGHSNVSVQGGFVEATTNEVWTAVSWGSSTQRRGFLLAADVTTGKRRVLSGEFIGEDGGAIQTVGAGPLFKYPTELHKLPSGKLLVLNDTVAAAPEVFEVDPQTGDRTVRWRGSDPAFGQCKSGDNAKSVQYTAYGLAVDTDGSFLLGYANALVDGRGVVRISADGKTCTSVTGSGSMQGAIDKGQGPALGGFVQGLMLQDGKIYALTTQPKALWSIDPATGNRTIVVQVGTATGLGERRILWDAARKWFWVSGVQNSTTITAYEPATNTLYSVDTSCGPNLPFKVCWGGPININTLNYGGIYLHPTNGRLFFGHDAMSIVEVEPTAGNSITISL